MGIMDHRKNSHSPAEDSVGELNQDNHQERRTRILEAAQACFVRSGFHRTTMQDVAAEVGMSPGNLYRYFPSKDAIAVGLAERDRARISAEFAELMDADDLVASFAALGRKHFADEPRARAVLSLEIWAEATRNPTFAGVIDAFESDMIGRMAELFRRARERGTIAADVDPEALATVVSTLGDGLFVRRAVAPDFDPEREVGFAVAVIEAALAGRIDLTKTADRLSSKETAS
jgi:TetR/AcrR family transcriptional repressor of uid operon